MDETLNHWLSYYRSTSFAISTPVHSLIINSEKFISTNEIFLNIQYYLSQYFFIWTFIYFENFNISENNVISVKLAKIGIRVFSLPDIVGSKACQKERKKDKNTI